MKIKTRFAPSPTGNLHVGNMRTALYAWLFAKKFGGKFILRIEDTDLKRSNDLFVKTIIDSLNWLNLKWDEGPYFQTNRIKNYYKIINNMLINGTAYKCFCSKERLEKLRKSQIFLGKKPQYDRYCIRFKNKFSLNKDFVIRFKNPENGVVIFNDLIRGIIKFKNEELDDLIICRSDGIPTYNFCVAIDDFEMKITHIIRGEDHINNTPRQINILKSIGAPIPKYAHVSTILSNDGKRLSKRNGAISILDYRDNGILPESLLNHLLRLGWSHGDQEIFTISQMKSLFNFKSISKSSSIFDEEKLLWLNQYYINNLSPKYVSTHLKWFIKKNKIDISNGPKLTDLINFFGKRCKTLKELAFNYNYLYKNFKEFEIDIIKKYLILDNYKIFNIIKIKLSILKEWSLNLILNIFKETSKELKLKKRKIGMPLRVAITGLDKSPPIEEIIYLLGREKTINRINFVIDFILKKYK